MHQGRETTNRGMGPAQGGAPAEPASKALAISSASVVIVKLLSFWLWVACQLLPSIPGGWIVHVASLMLTAAASISQLTCWFALLHVHAAMVGRSCTSTASRQAEFPPLYEF